PLRSYSASQDGCPPNAADAKYISGSSQTDVTRVGGFPNRLEAFAHDVVQLLPDTVEPPAVVLPVLHPFEIAGGHTAGVDQDVGQNDLLHAVEVFVGLGPGRRVGGLDDDRCPNF